MKNIIISFPAVVILIHRRVVNKLIGILINFIMGSISINSPYAIFICISDLVHLRRINRVHDLALFRIFHWMKITSKCKIKNYNNLYGKSNQQPKHNFCCVNDIIHTATTVKTNLDRTFSSNKNLRFNIKHNRHIVNIF